jgi:AraC-like DNA-binding protein
MEREKPFRDSTLTLQELADRLDVSRHHLSEVLNAERGETFFDFVNGYRVDEVKRMLADRSYENLTLMAIAEEAGFSSKSTFNDSFKRLAGMTPSEYRERPGSRR